MPHTTSSSLDDSPSAEPLLSLASMGILFNNQTPIILWIQHYTVGACTLNFKYFFTYRSCHRCKPAILKFWLLQSGGRARRGCCPEWRRRGWSSELPSLGQTGHRPQPWKLDGYFNLKKMFTLFKYESLTHSISWHVAIDIFIKKCS